MTRSLPAFAATLLISTQTLLGCSTPESGPSDPIASGPTYFGEAKAILDEKCVSCHQAGGIGPQAFETYAQVLENASAIKSAVASGAMPPWIAADGCNDYQHDRSLSADDKETLLAFLDAGAAEGDRPAEAEDAEALPGLSRVDRTMKMPVAYTPQGSPDDYRCFLLDWEGDEDEFVTGFRVAPGNASTVHHVIAYLVPPSQVGKYEALDAGEEGPGYTCFGGPGGGVDQDTAFVGSWAPGSAGGDFPAGTGIRVQPGSKIALQVHYNTLSGEGADQTAIELKLDEKVEREAHWQFFTNLQWVLGAGMDIPAMTDDVQHDYALDPTPYVSGGKPITIYSVGLHMHTLGQSARLSIERSASQAEQCLLDIPQWDFHWQGSYDLVEPVSLSPGDKLGISCTWDNPTTKSIAWGEGTGDEMCLGLIYFTEQ